MKWRFALTVLTVVVVVVAVALAVGAVLAAGFSPPGRITDKPGEEARQQDADGEPSVGVARTNADGAVAFRVTPLSVGSTSEALDFEVVMDTHSVDLGFDLAQHAVLQTDTGAEITPSAYRGGGGHHVTGRLSFPAAKIAGARTWTLLIRDIAGVAEREFVWQWE